MNHVNIIFIFYHITCSSMLESEKLKSIDICPMYHLRENFFFLKKNIYIESHASSPLNFKRPIRIE